MRYMMLIKSSESYRPEDVPPSMYQAMDGMIEEMRKNGNWVDGAGLQRTPSGRRLRLEKGKISVTDGPFVETKEVIGGYAIIDAKSREEALDIARRFMELHRDHWPAFEGELEVRPFQEEGAPAS